MATSRLSPIDDSRWGARAARHLLNRAGFGVTRDRVAQLAGMSPDRAVASLVHYESAPASSREPGNLVPAQSMQERRMEYAGLDEDARRKLRQEEQRAEREAIQQLKAWWLERMATTARPLEEKMTLFWHGHFATSAQKVKSSQHTYELNRLFREQATGNFRQLTIAVGQSPSMLRYLDNIQSTKAHPNENWARELMELFTMGQHQYTEDDIKNSARAFTGWTSNGTRFLYDPDRHDFGEKVFMGRRGNFDGWDIVDIIFERPATAEYIARELWLYFASENADEKVVKGLAETLRAHDYDLKPMLTQLLLSTAFYGEEAMGTQIKSPAQFLVQLAHDLRIENPPYPLMARGTREMGQDLFMPPNVKGWDGNRAWINANSLLIRYNMPVAMIFGQSARGRQGAGMAMEGPGGAMMGPHADGDASPANARWNTLALLDDMKFASADECVKGLADSFLSVPLSAEQRRVLLEALGAADAPDAPLAMNPEMVPRLNAALHLLFSTAEYQLC